MIQYVHQSQASKTKGPSSNPGADFNLTVFTSMHIFLT